MLYNLLWKVKFCSYACMSLKGLLLLYLSGLRMLHNIMKQYRRDFKKIPILRKLLKVQPIPEMNNLHTLLLQKKEKCIQQALDSNLLDLLLKCQH